jgi:hypothetical protein
MALRVIMSGWNDVTLKGMIWPSARGLAEVGLRCDCLVNFQLDKSKETENKTSTPEATVSKVEAKFAA